MAIGQFISIDPLAEKYAYQSPYNFSENRVIGARELEDLEGEMLFNKSTDGVVEHGPREIATATNSKWDV